MQDTDRVTRKYFGERVQQAAQVRHRQAGAGSHSFHELQTRLVCSKTAAVRPVYLLLFEVEDTELQQQAFACLKENVQDAAGIISMAVSQQPELGELRLPGNPGKALRLLSFRLG